MSEGRFAGVDWASAEHAVCVVDEQGRIVEGRRFRHDEPGIRALCARLVRARVALVALERPDGLLIERLLDAGLLVVAVHPNQVKAMRPRYSVAGGKSDVFDSFVLAELARTDSHRFRILVPDSDQTKALRATTRARESLVRTRVGLANQLRDQLACFWPGAANVFCSVDTHIALAFLRRYPSPADAHGLGEQRLDAFLKRHGYPGRKPASELLDRLRSGAEGRADELEMHARRQIVLALVSALQPIVARISELTIEIRRQIDQHPDGQTFRSPFIDPNSWLCAATMIAEIGDCRDRYPSYRALAADAGQAPVAVESGNPATPNSDGPATTASATRSTHSLTQAAATTPGPPTSTREHAPAAPATPTQHASSAAPGHRSSGASGTTTTPTTPTNTPPSNASSPPKVDTGGLKAFATPQLAGPGFYIGTGPGGWRRCSREATHAIRDPARRHGRRRPGPHFWSLSEAEPSGVSGSGLCGILLWTASRPKRQSAVGFCVGDEAGAVSRRQRRANCPRGVER